jgi:hypothetical protein
MDGSLLFELVSPHEETSGRFGFSVDGAGDINQDGAADLVVGARDEDGGQQDSGRAYVFSGVDGSVLLELVSPNPVELGLFGISIAGAGDVNQDASPDVIVGATGEGQGGRVYVLSGENGSLLFDLVSPRVRDVSAFGNSVATTGDVNLDGAPDVLVGSPSEFDNAGRAYVFSGQNGDLLFDLVSPNEESTGNFGARVGTAGDVDQDGAADVIVGAPSENDQAGRAYVFLAPFAFRVNSGGANYIDVNGSLFVADRGYAPGGFGHVGGLARHFDQPIGGTDDDPLYQDVRVARRGDSDGVFSYRFDVPAGLYDVTLHLMAPELEGPGNVVMDVRAEEDVVFDDLDVTAEAGGAYQALVKVFAVDVSDGTLDLRFRAVNKAAVVSAIAVAPQAEAGLPGSARRELGGER